MTRADFFVGRGPEAEWIGSIAFDGYPSGMGQTLLTATTEAEYRKEVASRMQETGSATLPSQGWPWPWDDSRTTDYAYAFGAGKVWAAHYGYEWFDPLGEEPDIDGMTCKTCIFPDMSDRENVTLGERSGLIVFRAPGP
jgi:hypothetical protein